MCTIEGSRNADRPASPAQPASSRPVLLMADADHLTVWSLKHYLRDSYAVVQASRTPEALDFLRHRRVDAVVVSDNLPGGELERVVELALQRVPAGKVIKLQSLVEEAPGEPPAAVIVLEKPFDLGHLKELLEDLPHPQPTDPVDGPSAEGAP